MQERCPPCGAPPFCESWSSMTINSRRCAHERTRDAHAAVPLRSAFCVLLSLLSSPGLLRVLQKRWLKAAVQDRVIGHVSAPKSRIYKSFAIARQRHLLYSEFDPLRCAVWQEARITTRTARQGAVCESNVVQMSRRPRIFTGLHLDPSPKP